MKRIRGKQVYLLGLLALALIAAFVFFMFFKRADGVVYQTYCSDICPDASEWVPFQVYEWDVTEDECKNLNGSPNYGYGWSSDYLGCTPEGYKDLDQATEEMWANQNN